MKRLHPLFGAVSALLLAASACAAAPPDNTPAVDTADGRVIGQVQGEVASFRGIPFAAPPVRQNRWRDPQPVAPWSTALRADRYAPMCLQPLRATCSPAR